MRERDPLIWSYLSLGLSQCELVTGMAYLFQQHRGNVHIFLRTPHRTKDGDATHCSGLVRHAPRRRHADPPGASPRARGQNRCAHILVICDAV